jgi:hypothetical protein
MMTPKSTQSSRPAASKTANSMTMFMSAAGLEDWVDFGVIIGILCLNASVGWYQEKQAADVSLLYTMFCPSKIHLLHRLEPTPEQGILVECCHE